MVFLLESSVQHGRQITAAAQNTWRVLMVGDFNVEVVLNQEGAATK